MEQHQIIARLLAREPDATEYFLRRYTPLIRYIIAPILPDQRDQEECICDVALRVLERITNYDPQRSSFTTWLTVLTRNMALNRARSANPSRECPLETALPLPAPGPEDAFLQKERLRRLQQVLMTLGNRDRSLLYRKYYYLQPTAQIARELGMTERAVEGRLYRLKKQLKTTFGGDFLD